ncbi:uncharacterized protein LOC116001222 [Ipomoea triloba]|uniref:uncharacterized protein LOC116001222 n=1 Tax=Ipomoea triloba TaxID=35885 RepID=UPI00125E46AE|nr:uncharacterized protein LOC116001222 [Ipomoea triloba]
MANRRAIESVDTTLRDIMDTDQIFGGKVVVFGGDFRQTLPVIRYGKKEDFIEASLVKSPLIWPTIRRLKLVQNICANEDPAFCEYLMKIGDGTEQLVGRDKIKIPCSFIIPFGEYKGKHVFIPRIPLEPSKDENCPIPFKRTQFPIKICFAMTINKVQGQTLDFVGIYLKEPVFSHGQLYVAMSRAKKAESVKTIIFSDDGQNKLTNITNNIVYQEILEYIS